MRTIEELTSEEVAELIKEYKDVEGLTISQIIEKYNLDLKPFQLVKNLPPYLSEMKCPYCNCNMVAEIRNRKDELLACPNCKHTIFPNSYSFRYTKCSCSNCEKIEKEFIDELYEKIWQKYNFDDEYIKYFKELNAKAIAQLIFFMSKFYNFNDQELIFGGEYDFYKDYIKNLKEQKIIFISPNNPIRAFSEIKFPDTPLFDKAFFDINVFEIYKYKNIFEILDDLKEILNEKMKFEVFIELMHLDLMFQFESQMNKRGFCFKIVPEYERQFKILYEKLSYAEIDCLLYYTAKDLLDLYETNKIYKKSIPSYALKSAVKKYDRYFLNGWHFGLSDLRNVTDILEFYIRQVMGKDIDILNHVVDYI